MENREKVENGKFCWCCQDNNGTSSCSKCERWFHWRCLDNDKKSANENWICPVCVQIEQAKYIDDQKCLDLMPTLVKRMMNDLKFKSLKDAKDYFKSNVADPMDLNKINEKVHTYSSFIEFLFDIQSIGHYGAIATIGNDKHEKQRKERYIKASNCLFNYAEIEIDSIQKCAECYLNANENPMHWFTMVCSKPHLVLWTKYGCTYYPTKLMSINDNVANVRFFGDHTHSNVPTTKCYLYSERRPGPAKKMNASYERALNETKEYIENVRTKFGAYNLAEVETALSQNSLDRYILDTIPNVRAQNLNKRLSIDSADFRNETPSPISLSEESDTDEMYGPDDNQSNNLQNQGFIDPKLCTDDSVSNNRNDAKSAQDVPIAKKSRYMEENADVAKTWNIQKAMECMKKSADAAKFLQIAYSQVNAEFNNIKTENEQLKVHNEQLVAKNVSFCNQNEVHLSTIAELQEIIERYEIEKARAVDEAKTQCHDEYTRLLERAKTMKYCQGCGSEREQDQIYLCNPDCNRLYCGRVLDRLSGE